MDKIFTPEFLEEIGFKEEKKYISQGFLGSPDREIFVKPPYGRAIDKRTNGMTVLSWNEEGTKINYFSEPVEENIFLAIGKDGGTRTGFNGIVHNQDDVRKLLKLVI